MYTPGLSLGAILLVAFSLSIGWGVRGNWGHEFGAMIPGALAALAAVLVSGREDWRRRIVFFAFFGALGWSFGGSMSYGQVLGYTHSDQLASVLYGFGCLFVIGFLWGAMGGAGTALPAALDRKQLTDFFPPLCAIFLAWMGQYFIFQFGFVAWETIEWYDTDWLAALTAPVMVLLLAAVRRRFDRPSQLMVAMAAGWWIGLVVLVLILGLRMTPPRSDNWAGCLGMVAAMLIMLYRWGWKEVIFGALMGGFFSGGGFVIGNYAKLTGFSAQQAASASAGEGPSFWLSDVTAWLIVNTGLYSEGSINWHSVMEQKYGFISGVGIALLMGLLATRTGKVMDDPPHRLWTERFGFAFVLLLISYLNIRKNTEAVWLKNDIVPPEMFHLSAYTWFNIGFGLIAAAVLFAMWRHTRESLPLVPNSWLGRGQGFYLLFLWIIVIGNLIRVFPFPPGRMITEGVIHFNACLCSVLLLGVTHEINYVPEYPRPDFARWNRNTWAIGLLATVIVVGAFAWFTLPLFDEPLFGANVRFGELAQ